MKRALAACLTLAAVAVQVPAHADALDTARQLFDAAAFQEARDLAAGIDTVEALILTARTYSGEAGCSHHERALYESGLALAEAARDRAPDNAAAWLQIAHNKGGRLRDIGYAGGLWFTGRLQGELVSLRDAFATARSLDPDNPEPYLGLGSLQFGLLAAGRGHYIDATEAAARANFERVFALDPNGRSAHYLFAKSLWDLDSKQYAETARAHAEIAAAPCPNGGRCECTRDDAGKLLAKIAAG